MNLTVFEKILLLTLELSARGSASLYNLQPVARAIEVSHVTCNYYDDINQRSSSQLRWLFNSILVLYVLRVIRSLCRERLFMLSIYLLLIMFSR